MAKRLWLEKYREKRDFDESPEPSGGHEVDREGPPVFVIHRHEARHLHYDLRLEADGVLISFAIPKGFSFAPEDKHLAVHTEDHPLAYETFEGVIPKGNYGAGTMLIWDTGTYELTKGEDVRAAVEAGKLEIRLFGHRVRGEWHLVRTQRSPKDWLLFKHRDRFARERKEPGFPLDLSGLERQAPPKRPRAMIAERAEAPFSETGWWFELDFDGARVLIALDRGEAKYFDVGGKRCAYSLPRLERELAAVHADRALLDGVLTVLDDGGRPNRTLLDAELASGDDSNVVFQAFDLLFWEEWSLRDLPLRERKRALKSVLPNKVGGRPATAIQFVDSIPTRGEEFFAVLEQGGLPGMIAKEESSRYRSGTRGEWRRVSVQGRSKSPRHLFEELPDGGERKIRTKAKLTHLDKVYWPEDGITKGQLLDYYDRIADSLLPYLRDRPLHMRRFPEGIHGESFYHKNVTKQLPSWVATTPVKEREGETVRYVMCQDRDTLLYLVNLGSIDLHPWFSRCDALLQPDWAIIDLDPGGDDFAPVVTIAKAVGKLLRGAGLRPLAKTSGASGLHIYVPVIRQYTYEQTSMFCEAVARLVAREHSGIATVERSVAKRQGKLYIDYLQNKRGQTIVPPYVVRPQPGATVSTPLDWDEVNSDLHPSQFTIFDLPDRLERRGDLFRPALDDPQDLAPAIVALDPRG